MLWPYRSLLLRCLLIVMVAAAGLSGGWSGAAPEDAYMKATDKARFELLLTSD